MHSKVLMTSVLISMLVSALVAGAAEMSPQTAQNVAQAIISWNGENPGDLFKAVKQANPEAGAITSLRELNKFMSTLPPEIRQAIVDKQNVAQQAIRQKILTVREAYYHKYRSQPGESTLALRPRRRRLLVRGKTGQAAECGDGC